MAASVTMNRKPRRVVINRRWGNNRTKVWSAIIERAVFPVVHGAPGSNSTEEGGEEAAQLLSSGTHVINGMSLDPEFLAESQISTRPSNGCCLSPMMDGSQQFWPRFSQNGNMARSDAVTWSNSKHLQPACWHRLGIDVVANPACHQTVPRPSAGLSAAGASLGYIRSAENFVR